MSSNEGMDPAMKQLFMQLNAPVLIGALFTYLEFGVLCVQSATYFNTFTRDRLVLRLLAAFILLNQILQVIFQGHVTWYKLLTYADRIDKLGVSIYSGAVVDLTTLLTATPCQAFFAIMAWNAMDKNIYFGLLLLFGNLFCFVAGAAVVVQTLILNKDFATMLPAYPNCWLWGMASLELVTSLVLIWRYKLLSKHAGEQGKHLLNKFMSLAFRTAALTASCSIVERIFHMTNGFYAQAPGVMLSGFYAMSLFHTLNIRKVLQQHGNSMTQGSRNTQKVDANSVKIETIVLREVDESTTRSQQKDHESAGGSDSLRDGDVV